MMKTRFTVLMVVLLGVIFFGGSIEENVAVNNSGSGLDVKNAQSILLESNIIAQNTVGVSLAKFQESSLEREFSPLAPQNAGYSEVTATSNSVFGNTEENYFVEKGSSLENREMNYKLSPSDFAFLYEGCKRCYYLKVVHGISQPSIPLPAIFSRMAGLLKEYYDGKSTKELHPDLPPGTVRYGEKYVQSNPIRFPSHKVTCFIRGRFDIVVEFEDKTYGVIDFKTGKPNEEYLNLYKRQIHAYAYALENPAPGALKLSPVTKMGLLYFYPSKIDQESIEWLSYQAQIHWEEIPKDEEWFLKFIGEVLGVLESPQPPAPSPDCEWCSYIGELEDI